MREKSLKPTWKEDISRALQDIGRPATTSEIFEHIRRIRVLEGRNITTHSRHGVRRILNIDFVSVGSSDTREVLYWFFDEQY